MARKPYKRRSNHMSSDKDLTELYVESTDLDTLDTLKLTKDDLPTNFGDMSIGELEFLAHNIEIYPGPEGRKLMRELTLRRRNGG